MALVDVDDWDDVKTHRRPRSSRERVAPALTWWLALPLVLAFIPGVDLLSWAARYPYQDLQRAYAQLAGLSLIGLPALCLVFFRKLGTGPRVAAAVCGIAMFAMGLLAVGMTPPIP